MHPKRTNGTSVRPRRRLAAVAALVALSLVLAACGSSSPSKAASSNTSSAGASGSSANSGPPIPMNLEIYSGSYYTWLAYLASAKGFFAKNGITANVIPITGGGPVAFAALANGGADVAMGDLSLAGPLLEHGVGLTAVSGAVAAAWELVAPKGSTVPTTFPASIKALQGQPVGVVSLGSSSYEYLQQLAIASGIGASGVQYTALGGLVANFVSALGAHRVAAAMVSPDAAYYLVNDLGDKLVYNLNSSSALRSAGGLLASTVHKSDGFMWARNGWLSAHPGAAVKFQRSMEEADVWMHNPANLPTVISLLSAEHDLATFEQGPGAAKFFAYALPYIISYAPPNSASVYMHFWVKTGLLAKSLPPSQWYSASIPSSASQVVAAVKAAGQGSLGNSA